MNGILVTTASFTLPRTSTFTGVPALDSGVDTYPGKARRLRMPRAGVAAGAAARTHRNVLLQARAEAAAGHLPNLCTRSVQDLGVLARRRSRRDDQTDAALGGAVRQLLLHHRAAQEVELLAAALA